MNFVTGETRLDKIMAEVAQAKKESNAKGVNYPSLKEGAWKVTSKGN